MIISIAIIIIIGIAIVIITITVVTISIAIVIIVVIMVISSTSAPGTSAFISASKPGRRSSVRDVIRRFSAWCLQWPLSNLCEL